MGKKSRGLRAACQIILFIMVCFSASLSLAAAPAGYSEYFIPGDEEDLIIFHNTVNNTTFTATHSVITVTAWAPNTVIYYDHWENGYTFDPQDPEKTVGGVLQYDEKQTLATRGASYTFESATIPAAPRNPANLFYDGRDRIYAIGGTVAVNRVTWPSSAGTVEAIGLEVYPVRPQLTTYIMPLGEDLAGAVANPDFERVFALVQATTDGTVVQFDLNGDGVLGDSICTSRNWPCTASATQVALNAGECFLLDRYSSSPTTGDPTTVAAARLNTGTIIQGNQTLQVHYLFCDRLTNYNSRGVSAFPTGFWADQYYAPVGSDTGYNSPTDIFLYNPHSTPITINYESQGGAGSFDVDPNATASYFTETGVYATQNSATYLQGSDVFWGISSIDSGVSAYDWSYSLIPATMLTDEYFIGWAPGAYADPGYPEYPVLVSNYDDSGLFITAAQDNVRVFVDRNSDGTADETFDLAHLQSRYVYDSTDGDMSRSNIWATGPITMAYGQNPDTAVTGRPAIDTGDAIIPGIDFVDLVLSVDKITDPVMVSTASGSQATYTLAVRSSKYTVDGVSVVDSLPAGWAYVAGTTVITLANKTTSTANPVLSGTGNRTLTWAGSVLGNMAENQEITITFMAQTTQVFAVGDMTRNYVEATGTRTVGSPSVTQTFTASDFAFNTFSNTPSQMTVQKTSSGVDPLSPGDSFTYTVTVTNNGASTLNGMAVYDMLPAGVSYVTGSSEVIGERIGTETDNVRDNFGSSVYNNNADGSASWAGNWVESDGTQSATAGNVLITGGELRLGSTSNIYRQVDLSSLRSTIDTATLTLNYRTSNNIEDGEYAYVEVAASASGPWTTALSFQNDQSASLTYLIPSSLWAVTTTVRIRTTGYDNWEYLYVDNADITYTHPAVVSGTFPANAPPNFVVSGDNYFLSLGQSLTLTFDVTVDNPLATGIDSITNTAYATSSQFLVSVWDDVTNIVSNPSSGSATVGDRVWFDADFDGVQDVGEPGLSNVEVTLKDLYGAPVAVTITGGNGYYLFEGVAVGTGYYVQVTDGLPSGLVQSFPSGRSDNRTNAFDLTAGQIDLTADLGYKTASGSAVIGDYVWHDADGDKVQDAGEPGLSGITVVLWLDDGDGVFEGAGQDTQVATQLTGADGHYLFTVAAPAGNTYFVIVDPSQSALTGYTPTTVSVTKVIGLNSGDARLINDFGFQNTASTYSIRDRVWFDTDEDGNDDVAAGDNQETGIAGVTIDLLNASRVVIATTQTDAGGYFAFVGLPGGGADYTVRITDTAGKLNDYYGTTASSTAGEWAVNNLTASVDYTVEPAEPHFGYSLKGAIGDTVFNDVDGNGSQGAGEFGINGVSVALYGDTNGNGLLNVGEPLAATLATDANGKYIFSGLADGNYIVSIATAPIGFTTYTTESPDNDPATGDQQSASIVSSSSHLDRDFGYRAATQRSVSGIIWEDSDSDGIIDGTESGLDGVTVEVLDSGGNAVGTATTNATGYYEFTGLPSGTYTVRITDGNGILTDFVSTYEVTEGAGAGSYDGQEAVNLSSGNASDIDFGYINPRVTRAVIGEFSAFNEGGKVVVRWQTVSEEGTVGFYLYRLDEKTGRDKMINNKLLPGLLHSPAGGWYSYRDNTAKTGEYYTYRLEEVEVGGNRISYGPWTVFTGTSLSTEDSAVDLEANAAVSGFKQAAQPVSRQTKERLNAGKEARLDAQALKEARKGIQAKISVTEEGLYFVNAEDIAQVLNKARDEVFLLIRTNKIRLRNKGRSVALLPASDNSGLYFYGEKIESRYTDENVYWLDAQKATIMSKVNRAPEQPAGYLQYFRQQVREEESHYPVADLFSDPKADFWMWDYVFPGYGRDQVSLSVFTPGVMDADTATLTVVLQGGSEAFVGNDHHAVISVNGVALGDTRWDGTSASIASFPVDTEILNSGENSVEISGVKESGVPYDIFYINYLTIEYPRHYTAADNYLAAENSKYDTLVVDGFTDPDIRVFDIANPLYPKWLSGVGIEAAENNAAEYQVSFKTGNQAGYQASLRTVNQAGRYLAVTPDAIKSCTLVADQPSSLSNTSNRGNYLVITSGDLVAAAQELADYRSGQGYKGMVVDVEDIYDEFAYGIKDAEAIHTFLQFAYSKWRTPPKYVLLAGEGSFDYKDIMGFGDSNIPPLLTATPEGLFVTDNLYADVSGDDEIPEFSIGRVPVVNAEEFSNYTSKVIGYESAGGEWRSQALLAADIPDAGGNFPASSEEVAGFFPDEFAIDRIYLDAIPLATARTDFLANINEGRAFVNFIGHGGLTLIGNNNLFSIDKIAQLQNDDRLPVMTAMTCLAGNYGYPGLDSISEAMVLKENGGAVAMWSPSGFAFNHYSVKLCNGFYGAVFSNSGAKTLGDAIRRSQKGYAASGEHLYYLNLYNLMGDPALVIK